jgi:hypothetical protein
MAHRAIVCFTSGSCGIAPLRWTPGEPPGGITVGMQREPWNSHAGKLGMNAGSGAPPGFGDCGSC